MDMYKAIMAENRLLEKLAKKLVDTTSSHPGMRIELIDKIAARIDTLEAAREMYIYPEIRTSPGFSELLNQYNNRISALRETLNSLFDLDPKSTDDFQIEAEILEEEIADYIKWENGQAHPVLRKIIDAERAAELGKRIREIEKAVFKERLKKY